MNALQLVSTHCESLSSFLVNLGAKSTSLLVAALLIDRLLGRRRVLLRSSLWHAALAGLAIVPIATLMMPPVSIAGLARPSPQAFSRLRTSDENNVAAAAAASMRPRDTSGVKALPATVLAAREPNASFDWRSTVVRVCAVVYLFGCLAMAVQFARSLRAVASLVAAAVPVVDERWNALLDTWRLQLGIGRQVRLLASLEVAVPVQIGWLRPCVLLPDGVSAASDESIRAAVLIHELGHVRRGDYGWNLLLRALSTVYWPQPLVWLADRQIRQLRERACDDLCIHWLGGSSAYRDRLVALAAKLLSRRPIVSLGIAMSHGAKLALRLRWIDGSPGRRHCLLFAPARYALVAAAMLGSLLLGTATLSRSIADEQPPAPAGKTNPSAPVSRDVKKQPTTAALAESDPAPADAGTDDEEPQPLRVRVERVKRQDLTIEAAQPCTLAAIQSSNVYARVPGHVKRLHAGLGDRVKKGDVLAELESPELAPELAQAESQVAEAEAEQEHADAAVLEAQFNVEAAEADRQTAESELEVSTVNVKSRQRTLDNAKKLAEQRAINASEVEEMEDRLRSAEAARSGAKSAVQSAAALVRQRKAAVVSAQAAGKLAAARLRVAQQRLADAKRRSESVEVVSPFDGVVVDVQAQQGEVVGPPGKNMPICTVAQVHILSAVTYIPERAALRIQRGDNARVLVDALPEEVFPAKVSRMAYNIDLRSRTLRVEIDINNAGGRLRPGMNGIAAVALEVHPNVLSLPHDAFMSDHEAVYTVVNSRAVRTPVESRSVSFDRVEILSGLKEGDVVITALANPNQIQPDWRKQPRVGIVAPSEWIDAPLPRQTR